MLCSYLENIFLFFAQNANTYKLTSNILQRKQQCVFVLKVNVSFVLVIFIEENGGNKRRGV